MSRKYANQSEIEFTIFYYGVTQCRVMKWKTDRHKENILYTGNDACRRDE